MISLFEFCDRNNISAENFKSWILSNDMPGLKEGMFVDKLDDSYDLSRYVEMYKSFENEQNDILINQKKIRDEVLRLENEKIEKAKQEKSKALRAMIITSGFNFDGYTITKYSGYISGDGCVIIPRNSFYNNSRVEENLCGALVNIRRQALIELKEAAYNLGCNAVIGVDFDYMTMDPQHASGLNSQITIYEPYVICVTANGNAVTIEKNL